MLRVFGQPLTAALALLIARYLARKRIEKLARSSPKFKAMDGAIREGVEIPYSCKGGMCTSCRAKVTDGKVGMSDRKSVV